MKIKQEVIRKHSLKELIREVEKTATNPYSEWKMGIGSNSVFENEGCISTIVFSPYNDAAVLSAYQHFTWLGMTAIVPVPPETIYLFLYKKTWDKNREVIF